MNTKYPINGRVATLNDIIHEYGASSTWPENSSYNFFKDDNKETDDNKGKIISQPFQNLVFKDALDANNKFVGERPYEIVYFDNVYSTTERDITGKHMKIIQLADSSVFTNKYPGGISGHEYIKAGDAANPANIISGMYGFKFIVASQDNKKQYYYNYRTSTGEATVMYALRNIIKILKKHDLSKFDKNIKMLFFNDKLDNIIKNDELNNDAYKYLGDFIWTYKNINLENYTRKENSILNIIKNKGYLTKNKKEEEIKVNSIEALLGSWGIAKDNKNYSYNQESQYNQLKYYLTIFANSQRFFVSYVTGFRFGKISNKSYLQIEPVLRCDLGAYMLYKKVTVSQAIHDWRTALPQSAITEDTKINVILQYTVEYENINKVSTPITTTISLTWKDIISNSNQSSQSKNIWFTLRNAVSQDTSTSNKYISNTSLFAQYTYGDDSGYFLTIDKTSLGTLTWPVEDGGLLLTDETIFNSIKNNPLYNEHGIINYANTADPKTFGIDKIEDISKIDASIKGQYSPFGTLRMHNLLDADNVKSGYYCDFDLYRCKNFYMKQQNSQLSDINIKIYYSIPYETIRPNTSIGLISKTFEEVGYNNDDDTVANDKPNDILGWQKDYLKDNIIYSLPNSKDEVFITVSSGTAQVILYASGSSESIESTKKDSYINNINLELYYLNGNVWQLAEKGDGKDYKINAYKQKDSLPYYQFNFERPEETHVFWKFKFNDIQQFLYFRSNNIQQNNKQQVSIYPLYVRDENKVTIEGIIKGSNNIDIALQYLVYHAYDNLDKDNVDTTCLNCYTQSFINQDHPTVLNSVFVNKGEPLYIEPVSFKTSDIYQYQEINRTNMAPFNVAYETSNVVNNKKIYNFNKCSTLFGSEINNRRVLIDGFNPNTAANIYLAFEPIYIIEFGSIEFSKENDEKDGKPLVQASCKTRYDGYMTLNKFKYKIASGSNTTSIPLQDGITNMNIFSLYTDLIFIDSDLLKISDRSIDEDLQEVTKEYLISYDIEVKSYNGTDYELLDNGKVSILNGLTQSQINERLRYVKFSPNKQYLIDILFTKFRQRTGEIACAFSCNNQQYNGYLTLTFTKKPDGYVGTLEEGITSYTGSGRPISLPIDCEVTLKNNLVIPDKLKDKMKFQGWTYTGYTGTPILNDKPNNELTIKITGDQKDISITGILWIDQSVTVNNTITPQPSTPDTSNNNP